MSRITKLFVIVLFLTVIITGRSLFVFGVENQSRSNLAEEVSYDLPYPGILPDNPIYILKVARDNLVVWIIRNPVKKAFYLLLLSDKRLASGEVLIHKGKKQLGAETISKAEEYFAAAVEQAMEAQSNKQKINDLRAKLSVSSAKHAEIIARLRKQAEGKELQILQEAWQKNQNTSEKLRSELRI